MWYAPSSIQALDRERQHSEHHIQTRASNRAPLQRCSPTRSWPVVVPFESSVFYEWWMSFLSLLLIPTLGMTEWTEFEGLNWQLDQGKPHTHFQHSPQLDLGSIHPFISPILLVFVFASHCSWVALLVPSSSDYIGTTTTPPKVDNSPNSMFNFGSCRIAYLLYKRLSLGCMTANSMVLPWFSTKLTRFPYQWPDLKSVHVHTYFENFWSSFSLFVLPIV